MIESLPMVGIKLSGIMYTGGCEGDCIAAATGGDLLNVESSACCSPSGLPMGDSGPRGSVGIGATGALGVATGDLTDSGVGGGLGCVITDSATCLGSK